MSFASGQPGKVVIYRSVSLDGFIAAPGDAMDWIFEFVPPHEFPDIMAAAGVMPTGAYLAGRRTYEVGKRMRAAHDGGFASSEEASSSSEPEYVLTHEPPSPPDPAVTFLSGDIGDAVATARAAAGGKNLEILGADVAAQALCRGLVDEILVYVMPVLLGGGTRFLPGGLPRIDLEPLTTTQSGPVTILRFRVGK